MKKFLLVLLIGMVLALVACASGDSESLCDNEESRCIGVRFDGKDCTVEEPTDTSTGEYTIILVNEGDSFASFELVRVDEGKTLEELEDAIASEPRKPDADWISGVGIRGENVPAGETISVNRIVLPGDYGALCMSVPMYFYYGGGFTIES